MSADGKRYSGCHESAYRWSCADRECKATSPRRCSKARSSLPRREVTRWSILPNCGNSEIKRPYPFHPYSPMLQCMLRQTPHTPAHHARTHTHHARTHARTPARIHTQCAGTTTVARPCKLTSGMPGIAFITIKSRSASKPKAKPKTHIPTIAPSMQSLPNLCQGESCSHGNFQSSKKSCHSHRAIIGSSTPQTHSTMIHRNQVVEFV